MYPLFAQQPGQLTQQQQDQINAEIAKISYGPVGLAGMALSLIVLVLLILIIIKMFQNNATTLGIVTIFTTVCCAIGPYIALIFGWVKSGEWNMRPLMLIYTVALLLYTGVFGYQITQMVAVFQSVMAK